MDELDLLKKDWNKPSSNTNKVSIKEIYAMLHKKSSSIVKTLFYISIAELVFWTLLNVVPYISSEAYRNQLDAVYTNKYVLTAVTVISYIIILIFVYLLYNSYKSISVTDNAKKLMQNILKTRKIIKYYVLYNLIVMGISLAIGFYFSVNYDPETIKNIASIGENGVIVFTVVVIIFSIVFLAIFWLFYRLIYGILLKRLNRNYKELQKLEV